MTTAVLKAPGVAGLTLPRRLSIEAAGLCAGLLLVVLLAWGLSWLGLASRAASERQALSRGESPIAFDFHSLGQLIGETAQGAERVQRTADGVELRLGPIGVNAGLNFRGRVLDSALFPELRLVLDSSVPAQLYLIRQAPDGRSWATVEPLELATGLNPLKLDLATLSWKLLDPPDHVAADQMPAKLSVLRFYLAGPQGTVIRLREARFYVSGARLPLKALQTLFSRPERWLEELDRTLQADPGTLLHPPGFPARPVDALYWRLAQALVAAVVCGLVLWTLRRRGAVALRGAGFWALCAFPVLAMWVGDNPTPALLGFVVAALVLGLRRLPAAPPAGSLWRAWALSLAATGLLTGLLLLLPTSELRVQAERSLWLYPLWALLQQLALQRVLYSRLRRAMSQPAAAWMAATGFALWHAPNLGLMVLTLLGARLWCELYERSGRLLPVALSHALLGVAALQWLPPTLLRSAEVSSRFLGLAY